MRRIYRETHYPAKFGVAVSAELAEVIRAEGERLRLAPGAIIRHAVQLGLPILEGTEPETTRAGGWTERGPA